jgi:porphobilinogen deaminase
VESLKDESLTIASRDSLLALAQSIEAAHMLQARGAIVRILTLKTSGDLKLDAPLYDVAAAAAPKEGRAFFTRELDEALISGKADIAIHSFKDLPTEVVPGVGDPIFFSEESGADILVMLGSKDQHIARSQQIIGTSSLRRIHQLQHAMRETQSVTLRGNIITRLRKLQARENGMNAILIAGAGIRRLRRFASLHPDTYSTLLDSPVLEKIARELTEFKLHLNESVTIHELDELLFPTAPGQGVLALQMSSACQARVGDKIRGIFSAHRAIAPRVGIERGLMAALGTGCHAPLGVSALERKGKLEVAVCYSRKTQLNPPAFSDPVFLRRQYGQIAAAIHYRVAAGFWPQYSGGASTMRRLCETERWFRSARLNRNY